MTARGAPCAQDDRRTWGTRPGLSLLEKSEGFRDHTYKDVVGIPTIGYGHRLQPGESFPNGITPEQGTEILQADVSHAEASVSRLVTVPLTQGQFDALVDFVFNLGSGHLASSTLLVDLNEKKYDAAAWQLLQWDHAGHVEVAALKARRGAEYELWNAESAVPTDLLQSSH